MARTFTFNNAEEVKDSLKGGGGGGPIPGGEYILEITDAEDVEFAKQGAHKGMPALKVEFRVVETGTGEGVGQKITDWRIPMFTHYKNAKQSPAFMFYQFWNALGVELEGEVVLPENEDILGQRVGAFIDFADGEGQKDPSKVYNEIRRYFDPSEGVKEGAIPIPDRSHLAGGGGGFTSAPATAPATGDTTSPWSV